MAKILVVHPGNERENGRIARAMAVGNRVLQALSSENAIKLLRTHTDIEAVIFGGTVVEAEALFGEMRQNGNNQPLLYALPRESFNANLKASEFAGTHEGFIVSYDDKEALRQDLQAVLGPKSGTQVVPGNMPRGRIGSGDVTGEIKL